MNIQAKEKVHSLLIEFIQNYFFILQQTQISNLCQYWAGYILSNVTVFLCELYSVWLWWYIIIVKIAF